MNDNDNHDSCMTQERAILAYLQDGHSINPMEALDIFGCFRLASRISALKGKGYRIRKVMEKGLLTGKCYARYSLVLD